MRQQIKYALLMLIPLFCRSQSSIKHIVGVDLGYSSYPNYVGYTGELNAEYFLSCKHFALNLNVGAAPSANFGMMGKFSFMAGYTTKIDKRLSWHMLLGGVRAKTSIDRYYYNSPDFYNFEIKSFCLSTGFYYRISETNFLVGVNALGSFYEESTTFVNSTNGNGTRIFSSEPFYNVSGSVNYLFK